MEWKFCPYCAGVLIVFNPHASSCKRCGRTLYENPKTTIGIVLLDANKKIVLCVRGEEPDKGLLDTIGGFIDVGETVEESLYRELDEETGLKRTDITKPQFVTGEPFVHSLNGVNQPLCWLVFVATIINDKLVAHDDVVGFERLELGSLPLKRLSTMSDGQAAMQTILQKVYKHIAANA